MKHTLILLSLSLLAISAAQVLAGEHPAQLSAVQRHIQAKYDRCDEASRNNDAKALLRELEGFIAPDARFRRLHHPATTGRRILDPLRRVVKSGGFPANDSVILEETVVRGVTLKAGKAVVLVQNRAEYVASDIIGEVGRKNAVHHVVKDGLREEVWSRRNGTWMIRESRELKDNILIDGKRWKGKTTKTS